MAEKQHIGQNVKRIISASKFSSKEIAEKIGVSYQYLYKIYNNKNVDSDYLIQLSEILEVPISVFFGELHSKLNSELLGSIEKLTENIKSLNYKMFIIQNTCMNIMSLYERQLINLNESTLINVVKDKQFKQTDQLIRLALDVIFNIDSNPDKLNEYHELLKKVVPQYDPTYLDRLYNLSLKFPSRVEKENESA